jgi:hypothetical protein
MSIRCRCLLVRENEKPIWSDKDLRLSPGIGEWVQFEEGATLSTFRITDVMHTPSLEGLTLTHILLGELNVIGWNLSSRFWRAPHPSKA